MAAAAVARSLLRGLSPGTPLFTHLSKRTLATQTSSELRITGILKQRFPQASTIKVVDISGGCGAMYEIHIESKEFVGKRMVQQHQMVNEVLKQEIQEMHGIRIFTTVPK
uniref:BolA-like protein 3 n=1 Tax=Callorhinchus milii TaxID=7868 RepID=K4G090_CALMI|nr:bolA-like protein 3 [Callorhinchus milii]